VTSSAPFKQLIIPIDSDALIARVEAENLSQLAVLGPELRLGDASDWPHWLRCHPHLFQLRSCDDRLAHKLAELSQLGALAVLGVELGDTGAALLARLRNLSFLWLGGAGISADGARALTRLSALTCLHLGGNNIGDEGARALAKLPLLSVLDCSGNNIGDEGARALAKLSELSWLDCTRNNVRDDGCKSLAKLSKLNTLLLFGNNVGDVGARALSRLSRLTCLTLFGNIGDAGAKAISKLTELTSLTLFSDRIRDEGAKAIANLSKLTSLTLFGHIGDEGARALANLEHLTTLSLLGNEIGDEGAKALARLSQLSSLSLSSNSIGDEGARALARLSKLSLLALSRNNIGDEGAKAIARLGGLTALYLDRNNIGDDGAKAIARLSGLTLLDLDGNSIGDDGARALAGLDQLTTLSLNNNNLSSSGAEALAGLYRLDSLSLDRNELGDEAVRALAALPRLTSLSLRGTRLSDVTPLAASSELERLDLSDTGVSDLTPLVGMFERGQQASLTGVFGRTGVFLEHCPLVRPPLEIVAQGREAILNYFRECSVQDVDHLFEAKLLLVGEGGAGKTSLLRRLYQRERALPAMDETTRGIDVYQHSFITDQARNFRLNVWDFGGQQIYHATHQFFLTKNSLYVLVDDTRKDAKSVHDDGFKYWLEVIEALSQRSPVLIFQNEKGGRSKIIDQAGIKGRFPNVLGVYAGDLDRPDAAQELSRAIELHVQELPHIGEAVPAGWVSVRRALEAESRARPFISQQEYFDIYAKHLSFDRDKALHLSRYLHDLGVFLHFQDDRQLRGTVILQNQWATDAVFSLLDDERVKQAQGRFSAADCDRIWAREDYADMQLALLALMEKFELCYRLADAAPDRWIAPQLLSPSAPTGIDDGKRPGDLVLRYRYEFLPKGLVNRLMVRMHRYVLHPDQAWASGVLFERDGARVLVNTEPTGGEVTLRARGPDARTLLSVIASDLDALNDGFRGLRDKVSKWVPCCCSACAASDSPELFEERRLRKRRLDGKLQVECPASYHDVSVLSLLDGVELAAFPSWARDACLERTSEAPSPPPPAPRTIRIFLASSAELRPDRDAFDLYFRQQNDCLRADGMYLEIQRWEHTLDALSETRLQDEYNRLVRGSDIFVSLFGAKAGPATVEEFQVAHQAFKSRGKPFIYTYFRNVPTSTAALNRPALQSLWEFQDQLHQAGHYPTAYENVEQLKLHFKDQLERLAREERI
jgi:internalin A